MNPMFTRFFLMVAMIFATTTAMKVQASPLSDADTLQVQRVIASQLAAFADDDADKAFDAATPSVREAIGSSGRFLAMVRGAYPMVYRPSIVTFNKPEAEDGTVMQLVQITDDSNKSWIAVFMLEQQDDKSYRISGCLVAENPWVAI